MTLFEFIKDESLARKVFGKAEIEIIKKQLLGINLNQSEKNRLSRDIRPKFEFIKRCSVFKEEFNIKKGGEIYKQLAILRDKMLLDKEGKKIKRIFIFGSFAENKMTSESDIDISVEFTKINIKEASLFKKRILAEKKEIFDLSIFNNLPENIKEEVKRNGEIFFKDKRKNN